MEEKITLADVMSRINMSLNYPAISYDDVHSFFDMAIAELNTTLHTDLKSFHTMIKEYVQYMSDHISRIKLTSEPTTEDVIPETDIVAEAMNEGWQYYYNTSLKQYGVKVSINGGYRYSDELYGIYYNGGIVKYYKAVRYGVDCCFWIKDTSLDALDFNVLEYLSEDWIALFLIPYVCFKYTCRDGGTASTFAEEFTQGFQQLQEAYDVPFNVTLATYAHKIAYQDDVKEHLPNLNVKVSTKAIYKDMKHERQLNSIYGNMFDRGGW